MLFSEKQNDDQLSTAINLRAEYEHAHINACTSTFRCQWQCQNCVRHVSRCPGLAILCACASADLRRKGDIFLEGREWFQIIGLQLLAVERRHGVLRCKYTTSHRNYQGKETYKVLFNNGCCVKTIAIPILELRTLRLWQEIEGLQLRGADGQDREIKESVHDRDYSENRMNEGKVKGIDRRSKAKKLF